MSRLPALFLLLACAAALGACHRGVESIEPIPEAASPSPTAESSRTSLERKPMNRPSRGEALRLCDAYMGYEKNDCLDKVKRDYDQVVAALDDTRPRHAG